MAICLKGAAVGAAAGSGSGPNGSFFEAPAHVDQSKKPGATSLNEVVQKFNWNKFLVGIMILFQFSRFHFFSTKNIFIFDRHFIHFQFYF